MLQKLRTWFWKQRFNYFPAYRASGARVTFIAHDWREVRIKVPLSWRTRNYVGTTFGGSMYAAVDPIYMMMLIQVLGPAYVVWDKAASIRFRKPGNGTLYAMFRLTDAEIDAIRSTLERTTSIDRVYHIDLIDGSGTIHATVEKTVYIRKREPATGGLMAA